MKHVVGETIFMVYFYVSLEEHLIANLCNRHSELLHPLDMKDFLLLQKQFSNNIIREVVHLLC
jgi:hypothetical protein